MSKPATQYEVQDALDWRLNKGQSLRQAIVDQAETDLGVNDLTGQIEVTVENGQFVATFTEAK